MNAPDPFRTQQSGRLWAGRAIDPQWGAVAGLRIEWATGRFTRVEPADHPPRDYRPDEIHAACLLTPGLLNAHVHLDYAWLCGCLSGGEGFAPWLAGMIAARRALQPHDHAAARGACAPSLTAMAADGVTEAWDIDSYGWGAEALRALGMPSIAFSELLAPAVAGWEARWDAWRAAHEAAILEEWSVEGNGSRSAPPWPAFSAHAPYTVCPPALAAAGAWARRHQIPLAIHLAESPEEEALLVHGEGALRAVIESVSGLDLPAQLGCGAGAIERAARAGALGPATVAIHCNRPGPQDVARLAASRAAVVFCPGSHRFFGYPPYPLAEYRRAGVRLALGTDSLASNDRLSIRQEARWVGVLGGIAPMELLGLATGAGLGDEEPLGGRGRLRIGAPAQWALWQPAAMPARLEAAALADCWLDPATRCVATSVWSPGTGQSDGSASRGRSSTR